MQELRPGNALHLVTVAACVLTIALLAALGRRWRANPPREVRLRRGWAIATLVLAGGLLAYQLHPANYDPRYTLPLHLCDVAFFLSALAMWSERRGLVAVTYFWGLALSTQALVTPIEPAGPSQVRYWIFWGYHLLLFGAAVYPAAVRGFRPAGRDLALAYGWTLAYAAVIVPVDIAFDWSYGFLGPDDSLGAGTLLEVLPAWPERLAVMAALCLIAMGLLWVVWPLADRLRRR